MSNKHKHAEETQAENPMIDAEGQSFDDQADQPATEPEAQEQVQAEPQEEVAEETQPGTTVESVMVNTLTQAEKLVKFIADNQRQVGSDIALRQLDQCAQHASAIVTALNQAILADR
jgi:hypothetical protein